MPVHLWTVEVEESGAGSAKRLIAGSWSLPVHAAPSGPPSEIWYTPDGQKIVFVRADSPITGDSTSSRLELLNVASGAMQRLTQSTVEEHGPMLSPDGQLVAYSYPRDGKLRNEESLYWVPLQPQSTASVGRNATGTIDHDIAGAAWLPGNSLLALAGTSTRAYGPWRRRVLSTTPEWPSVGGAMGPDDRVFTIGADRLERMFPEIRNYLLRDSFVSINAAHRAAARSRSSVLAGIPRLQHRSETLPYLCACYCNLDCKAVLRTAEKLLFCIRARLLVVPKKVEKTMGLLAPATAWIRKKYDFFSKLFRCPTPIMVRLPDLRLNT
jgi:hypothetical protein